ncbi:PKD domain-containing protein [Methyloglobulus morosus KoM1]|uniref:PKD domain-containing protein n=1 Tax=Methyloglobulus morosus KoM1 TaxID=1116472 RepID=V5C6Q2_9GAMM|nr:PKD domain-containing protein [Methyloglobulus morosus KoM1]
MSTVVLKTNKNHGLKILATFVFLFLLFSDVVFAGSLNLAWDASTSSGVGGYKLYYGQASKSYTSSVDVGNTTTYQLTGLTTGSTYFFALKAYNIARSIESSYSNEASATISATTALTADFTPSTTSGTAPLTIRFTPNTTGSITTWRWDFPGSFTPVVINTTPTVPTVTYSNPGTYNVALTATGAKGSVNVVKQITVIATPAVATQQPVATPPPAAIRSAVTSSPTAGNFGLMAAYGFEEAQGTRVLDASGNGNHGKIKEAVRTKGRFGKALKFDGVNDWVTVKNSESLGITSAFTLEAWIKPISIRRGSIIVKQEPNGTVYDLYSYEDRDLPISSFNDGQGYNTVSGLQQLPVRQWVHLASTFDGVTQKLYINGVEVGSIQVQSGLVKQSYDVLRIGGNSVWGDYFRGYIDEVRIYNRSLSNDEILKDLQTKVSPH